LAGDRLVEATIEEILLPSKAAERTVRRTECRPADAPGKSRWLPRCSMFVGSYKTG
jgi:hypothetical protein